MAEHADAGHQQHDHGQHDGQARHEQQPQLLQVEADQQAQRDDHDEQHDAPHQQRFAERQRDQHRHERAEGLHADEVAQEQDHQRADRDHQQHAVDRLRGDRQREQREVDRVRAELLGAPLRDQHRVEQVLLHGQRHVGRRAALDVGDALVAAPPDEEIVRQALLERPRIEIEPLHAVVHFQQLLGLHRARLIAQQDAVRDARRDLGAGQQHGREPTRGPRRCCRA